MRHRLWMGLLMCSLQFSCTIARGQTPPDAATRSAVIDSALREMNQRYVFPDKAREVEAALRDPTKRTALDGATSAEDFAKRLTDAVQAVTRDKHIRVRYSAAPLPEPVAGGPTPAEMAEMRQHFQSRNFGVERIERLPGNIGLLDLRGFAPAALAGETLAAAMTLLAHSDALIFDLRRNGGGDPATVALLCSYLFDERTHLNDLYRREGNVTQQFWTQDWVPGPRYGASKPVLVLTSSRTFSGAEEFSNNLKVLKRATIVGETTGGGAHPGEMLRLHPHYEMFVPNGRAINPITGTNWEGTGVQPDIAVKADDALRVAQLQVLPALIEKATDPQARAALQARQKELAGR